MATATHIDTPRKHVDIAPTFSRRWNWLLTLGIVQLVAGAFAIAIPGFAALVAAAAFGWILIFASVLHLVHAFSVRQWRGFALHLVGGLLYAGTGVLLLLYPVAGVAGLAVIIALMLIIEGSLRAVLAFSVRPRDGWGWFLAAGISSIVLGAILFYGWPASSLWLVGWLLGFQLAFSGAMNISCAVVCRGCHRFLAPGDSEESKLAAAH